MDKQINKTPLVRFPEFKDDWSEFRLSELMSRVSKNNKDEEFGVKEILSLSSTQGIVDRKELLGDTYDKVNHKNYIKTRLNDLVYGKSISSSYPYGLFKVNDCRDGLLSTLYFTFKVNDNAIPAFLDRYFSYHNRANNFLKKYVLVGDRYITADANYILSGKIYTPEKKEQQKIANFFSTLDKKIEQLKQKKAYLDEYKKGIMQKIFAQELRFKDENGNDFPDWTNQKLGDIAYKNSSNIAANAIEENFGDYKIYGASGVLKKVDFYKEKEEYISIVKDGAGVGRVFLCEANTSVLGTLDIIKAKETNLYYLFYFLQQTNFLKYVTGSTIPHIYFSDYKSEKILVPIKEEQEKIANFLSTINDKISRTQAQIVNTQEYKKGLLQKMFV